MQHSLFGFFLLIAILQIWYIKNQGKINNLWHPLITPLFLTMVLGFWLNFIGNKTLYLNKLGGGFLLCLIIPSFLVHKDIIPEILAQKIEKDFFNKPDIKDYLGINFAQFFVTITTIGSILSIDKILLKKSFWKFIPLTLIALFCNFLLVGIAGVLLRYQIPKGFISRGRFLDTIFYFCNPLTSGGTNLGVNRFSEEIFPKFFDKIKITSSQIRSFLVAPLILTRILAILLGGILYSLFDKTIYSGNQKLEITTNKYIPKVPKEGNNKQKSYFCPLDSKQQYQDICNGLLIMFALYNGASIINKILMIYNFSTDLMVYLIVILVIIKIFDFIPYHLEKAIIQSSKFIIINFTPAALVCFGISIKFEQLQSCITDVTILIMVLISLLSVVFVVFLLAKSFGFYPLEASLTAGLCSHSVGSMGNIGIMSISHRMNLLPLANIATRIVGPIVFVMMNIFFKFIISLNP
ncbi:2-hydroxycarboxylate transporter family protein [Candidatus Phytoplasma solani]|uniref:2-hydroxycarboxylate transporter family protein n=1 Tax=Candidatus Phytoplasma solani TaxID=69896 RepID=UPI0032DBC3A8